MAIRGHQFGVDKSSPKDAEVNWKETAEKMEEVMERVMKKAYKEEEPKHIFRTPKPAPNPVITRHEHLLLLAIEYVVRTQRCGLTDIQRALHVDYADADRILKKMAKMGITDKGKGRGIKVLMDQEAYDAEGE